jgi:peptidoglycan lytic transglycosylase
MRTRSANIRTQRPHATNKKTPGETATGVIRGNFYAVRVPQATALLLSVCLMFGGVADVFAQSTQTHKKKSKKPKATPCQTGCKPDSTMPQITATTPEDEAAQRELASLAQGLRTATPGAYDKLEAFATKNNETPIGGRAALALGYEDYTKNRGQQALAWFAKAKSDSLLMEYVLYWSAMTKRTLKRDADAYADLQALQREYPNTAMKEQMLEAYAPTASELGHAQDAIDALNAYSGTATKPALLLERAHAYQAAHQYPRAAKDYQTIFYKSPLTDEAKAAGSALPQINHIMGKEYPYPGVEMQELRAESFFDAHKWREARTEYEKLLTMVKDPANPTRQRAQLRVAEARIQLKGATSLLTSLKTPDPEVDAERLYEVSQAQRSAKHETEMLTTIEDLAQKYPKSSWTEEALMAAGNFYWVALDRTRAANYYQRILDGFPAGKNAYNAEWRVAWVAYLDRQPYADDKLVIFLRKYPVSANAVDALYWLGRDAERSGNPGHARAYFQKAIDRFPETYFGHAAEQRLTKMPAGDADAPEFLSQIPPAPPLARSFDEPIPASVEDRWARAEALRSIGFESSAEQELKNAYFATSSPRFLLEAAEAAFNQGHFAAGMAYGRVIVPSFDSRKFNEIPLNVWKALYPLPYEASLRREASKNDFDPMFAAGLIRQESTFQADVVSYANAIGLMQLLPKTGKILAKQARVKYNKNLLFQPDYNIELGMLYIANLVKLTGAPEYAAAAYNAGEDRIALWKSERNYEEIPELVESIPFTQTREYVQIVLRNTEVYRMIYGSSSAGTAVVASSRTR